MQSDERNGVAETNTESNSTPATTTENASNDAMSRPLNLNSPSYNTRNPAVRRLLHEARELQHPTDQFWARPLEDNLFEWHFTIAGPSACEFEGGLYHGRIILPANYPLSPPSFQFSTPNGRFEINRKICLSISGHHPETWQPSWSIRTALLALVAFLPTPGAGAIGSLDYPAEERKKLAAKSRTFSCPDCGAISGHLLKPVPSAASSSSTPDVVVKSEKASEDDVKQESVSSENRAENVAEQASTSASSHQPVNGTLPQTFPISFSFPSMAGPPSASPTGGAAAMAMAPPPPFVAAAYLPYMYQTMFHYASHYAHQAAMAAVVAGAVHQQRQPVIHNLHQNNAPHAQPQQQQHLTPADLIAQQQHRERRASAFLFAIILLAWTITRFLDRFVEL